MKRFKDFLQEADIIKFPGPKKPAIPTTKEEPEYQTKSMDDIRADGRWLNNEIDKIATKHGRRFETPTLANPFGKNRPDFYTQLHHHLFSGDSESNPSFAKQHLANNKEEIHKSMSDALSEIENNREGWLKHTGGHAVARKIGRAHV